MKRISEVKFFVFCGPSADLLEDLAIAYKTKLNAAYFSATKNKIVAYKNGEEIQFVGDFNMENVN
jgi:hypothetical protein